VLERNLHPHYLRPYYAIFYGQDPKTPVSRRKCARRTAWIEI